MNDHADLTVADIEVLAGLAALPLPDGRAQVIREPLAAWVRDANELSRKMSQKEYLDLMPATIFHHNAI